MYDCLRPVLEGEHASAGTGSEKVRGGGDAGVVLVEVEGKDGEG